jgi:DNA-binding NtrC family response regulator
MDLAAQLRENGYEVLGPCKSVAEAMEIFHQGNIDAAVLDINLGPETSESVAVALKDASIPFIVASGYSPSQYPKVFANIPALAKPIQTDRLVSLLAKCA